jgi:hypothetical protein
MSGRESLGFLYKEPNEEDNIRLSEFQDSVERPSDLLKFEDAREGPNADDYLQRQGKEWANSLLSRGSYIFTANTKIEKGDFKPGQKIYVYGIKINNGRPFPWCPNNNCIIKNINYNGIIVPYVELVGRKRLILGNNEMKMVLVDNVFNSELPSSFEDISKLIVVKPRSNMEYFLGDRFTNNRYTKRRSRTWNLPQRTFRKGGKYRQGRRQMQRKQQKTKLQKQKRHQQKQRTRKQRRNML